MGKTAQIIEQKIREGLSPTHFEVLDESAGHRGGSAVESHFRLVICSRRFFGLSRVERHKRVYEILKIELESLVHALALSLFTPEEWEKAGKKWMQSPDCAHRDSEPQ